MSRPAFAKEFDHDGSREYCSMSGFVDLLGIAALAFVPGSGPGLEASQAADDRFNTNVFTSGVGGYHTYRIPSLLVTPRGTLLAFCEGRKTGPADGGDIDLLLRRSDDSGRTWGPLTLVRDEGGTRPVTIGNPCPVVDATTGTVWLTFCRNNDDVLVASSRDDGRTWDAPRTITGSVKRPGWTWYATGPGVGIQLLRGPHAGRLVIPCDHREAVDGRSVTFSHVFFSDDHGKTWSLGGTVDRHTNECQVVELADGALLINMRNYWGREGGRPDRGGRRAVARSRDGGASWSPLEFDATLIEPVCQASLIAMPRPGRPAEVLLVASLIAMPRPGRPAEMLLVFSNPASTTARRALTVRVSGDGGKTWPVNIPVEAESAAYSCLAPLTGGRVGLLYERRQSAHITFTVFPVAWPGEPRDGLPSLPFLRPERMTGGTSDGQARSW
jgi:sialidase-1